MPGEVQTANAAQPQTASRTAQPDALRTEPRDRLADPLAAQPPARAQTASAANPEAPKKGLISMGGFDEAGFSKVGRAIELGAPVDGAEAELGLKVSAPVLGWLSVLGGMELKAKKDEGAYTASAAFNVGIEAGVGKGPAKAVAGLKVTGTLEAKGSSGYEVAKYLAFGVENQFRKIGRTKSVAEAGANLLKSVGIGSAGGVWGMAAGAAMWSWNLLAQKTGLPSPYDLVADAIWGKQLGADVLAAMQGGQYIESTAQAEGYIELSKTSKDEHGKDEKNGVKGTYAYKETDRLEAKTGADGKKKFEEETKGKWFGKVDVEFGGHKFTFKKSGDEIEVSAEVKIGESAKAVLYSGLAGAIGNFANFLIANHKGEDVKAVGALKAAGFAAGEAALGALGDKFKATMPVESAIEGEVKLDLHKKHGEVEIARSQELEGSVELVKASVKSKRRIFQAEFHW